MPRKNDRASKGGYTAEQKAAHKAARTTGKVTPEAKAARKAQKKGRTR